LDSASKEEFIRELGRSLASDSLFLVYDARARHAAELDRLFREGEIPNDELRKRVHGGEIALGLFVRCRLEETYREEASLSCAAGALDLRNGGIAGRDSALFIAGLLRRTQALQSALVASLRDLVLGKPEAPKSQGPALRLIQEARPARLLRQESILARGGLDSIPVGFTLNTGDMPKPALARVEDYYLVLYPHSSYSYVLPGVLCLNRGTLGLIRGDDTTRTAAGEKSGKRLEKSNALWKTVGQLAALDTHNTVWKALGKAAASDSQSSVSQAAKQGAGLNSTHPAIRVMEKLAALDGGEAALRALVEVAALDSSNLIWKGIGKSSLLDGNHQVWRRLADIPPHAGSLWREIGLLSQQENILVLTPSCVLRGRPKTAQIRHTGSLTRVEMPQGEVMALPILSSQQPAPLHDLEWGETHGFAWERGKLSARGGDRLTAQLTEVLPRSDGLDLTDFLPGKLFARGRAVATPGEAVQRYFLRAFGELGATPDYLLREPPSGAAAEKGSDASGCYLCRPNRVDP
jgi:hypothetical protein